MNEKTLRLIVIFSSLALVGLITTQSFWILKSYRLKEQQLEHRINMALNDVIDEIKHYKDSSKIIPLNQSHYVNKDDSLKIISTMNLSRVDTLLKRYFDFHMIDLPYCYSIVQTPNGKVIFNNSSSRQQMKRIKSYKVSLSCLYPEDSFHLEIYVSSNKLILLFELGIWLFLSALFTIIFILSFAYILLLIYRQKKVSVIKNDFINNMTHEFKTPISTISLACEILKTSKTVEKDEKIQKYIKIIADENFRMRKQVDRVLQMALINRGEYKLQKEFFDVKPVIQKNVESLCLDFCDPKVLVKYDFEDNLAPLYADKIHFTNIILNLLQNSIKYSKDNAQISVSAKNFKNGMLISVEDNGIGMNEETQKHIFEKFYRVPSGDKHDVKGFGLGLYYVKTMVEAHEGYIKVKSQLNKGSKFDVFLPTKH